MIEINNITKKFDANNEIRFQPMKFENGKSYVITGPSGCGKSTLLNLISGIISPTKGEITWVDSTGNTQTVSKFSQKERDNFRFEQVGYIFQDYKLIEDFSVIDNLEVLNINKKVYERKDFEDILEKVQLKHKLKQKVKHLSGGEKQRVAIARALVKKNCDLILADEPTESLNEKLSHEIVELLTRLSKEQEKTVIMVTHDNALTKYFDVVIRAEDFLENIQKEDSENV